MWALEAGTCGAEAERTRAQAQPPQPNPAPTMAMSLGQSLTVEAAPVNEEVVDNTIPRTQNQSGEQAAELTPDAALVDPIESLTLDTDTETVVPSPIRRASVSAASPSADLSPRSGHKSAIH